MVCALIVSLPSRAVEENAHHTPADQVGGRIYRTQVDAGGASISLWRYVGAGGKSGPPILLVPELFCERIWYDEFAQALQRRGRDVFLFEWRGSGDHGVAGHGTPVAQGFGDISALLLGDAPAAFDAALAASGATSMELIGHGLGGEAAVLLAASSRAAQVSSLALVSVPAGYWTPNEAVRRLTSAVRALPSTPADIRMSEYASMAAPLGDPARPGQWIEAQQPLDLFALLLAHGTSLSPTRSRELRDGLGNASAQLLGELAHWMESGELALTEGPRAPRQSLSEAWTRMAQPALLVVAPLDNLVHPEQALARRGDRAHLREEILLQRIEGFPEDAGHLAIQSSWGPRVLAPKILDWLAEHP